jgi:hypothetical protein
MIELLLSAISGFATHLLMHATMQSTKKEKECSLFRARYLIGYLLFKLEEKLIDVG